MATVKVRVCNAGRQPLDDRMDVRIVSARTDATVKQALDVRGTSTVKFDGLVPGQPHIVKVFPSRHRPVQQFTIPHDGEPETVTLYSPLYPDRVRETRFPLYDQIDRLLTTVLERSTVEGLAGSGAALYETMAADQRAGLFNLFSKMSSVGFDDQRTIWSFVDRIYRVRGDRVFADVQLALRDLVKGAVVTGRFFEAPGRLHQPPPGFVSAGSFKTFDEYGNLQLSFFASSAAPLSFKVDADIDDAAGLGHTFQVIRNFVTHGTTHPYDIHQILLFRQEATLPYELA